MTKFLITALVAGALMGLAFGSKDLFNPRTSAAEANRINVEAAHQQAVYELQERLSAAQTEAEIQKIQREQGLLDAQYQHDIQALAQDLAHREVAFKTWMTVITIFGGALSIAISIGMILWVGSKALASISFDPTPTPKFIPAIEKMISTLPEQEPYNPWNSPIYRRQKKAAAQDQERKEREEKKALAARMRAISNPTQMNEDEYNKLPLAGD